MYNPEEKYVFKQVDGIWRNVAGDSATLAETAERLGITPDEYCEYARYRNYEKMLYIIYRDKTTEITIDIWKLKN